MLTGQADEGWDTITTEFPVAGDGGDPFYPVPSREARKLYEKYGALAKADAAGVTFVGRLARYQYLAMPQVVGQALKAAKDLLAR
jgi:UDP-galactopyranose mutase